MKRKKYPIHKDFKKWNRLNPPINKFFAPILQLFLKPIFSMQKSSKDCFVQKKSVVLENKTKVKFLIYTPKNLKEISPCLIYYHGGGFVLPGAPYHYRNAKTYAVKTNCRVLFLDYPLAPKNKYPLPANICFDFYKFVLENSNDFKIDKNKIAVAGDSAGANLATAVCLMAKDNNLKIPACQMLIYPAVGIEPETESMKLFDDTGMCNNKDYKKYCKLYFKNDTDKYDRYASPLNQDDLTFYPPTYIETAEFDCLRDEGKIFAEKLRVCGVRVFTHNTQKTIHGYDIVKNNEIVNESLEKRINFLKEQFFK